MPGSSPSTLLPTSPYPALVIRQEGHRRLSKPGQLLLILAHWPEVLLETFPSSQTDNKFCPIIWTLWWYPVLHTRLLLVARPQSCWSGLLFSGAHPRHPILHSNNGATTRTTTRDSQAFPCCHGSFSLFLLLHLFFLQDAFHNRAKSNLARLPSSRQKSLQPPNDSVTWACLVHPCETSVRTRRNVNTGYTSQWSVETHPAPNLCQILCLGLGTEP